MCPQLPYTIKIAISSLDCIDEIVNLRGFLNSDLDFFRQPEVINEASELMVRVFGEKGKHTRCVLGHNPYH